MEREAGETKMERQNGFPQIINSLFTSEKTIRFTNGETNTNKETLLTLVQPYIVCLSLAPWHIFSMTLQKAFRCGGPDCKMAPHPHQYSSHVRYNIQRIASFLGGDCSEYICALFWHILKQTFFLPISMHLAPPEHQLTFKFGQKQTLWHCWRQWRHV